MSNIKFWIRNNPVSPRGLSRWGSPLRPSTSFLGTFDLVQSQHQTLAAAESTRLQLRTQAVIPSVSSLILTTITATFRVKAERSSGMWATQSRQLLSTWPPRLNALKQEEDVCDTVGPELQLVMLGKPKTHDNGLLLLTQIHLHNLTYCNACE